MNPVKNFKDSRISSQANEWLVQRKSGNFTADQQRALEAWLNEDPSHRTAYDAACEFWRALDGLSAADIAEIRESSRLRTVGAARKSFRVRPALAFCVLVLMALTIAPLIPLWTAEYRTQPGEINSIRLPDGSTVQLNTESAISVDFGQGRRRIELLGGEAFFQVVSDPVRPFDVISQGVQVRALGTAFDVRRSDDALIVSVFEHAVEVSFQDRKPPKILSEGAQSSIDRDGTQDVSRIDPRHAGAWREYRMVFDESPLEDVIAELNRYRRGFICIADNDLERIQVTGIFDTRNTDAALNTIEQSLPVRIYRFPGGIVVLSLRS